MKNKLIVIMSIFLLVAMFIPELSYAEINLENVGLNFNREIGSQGTANTVKLLILTTILALSPSFLILTTCFTRIVVVLSFLRNALGTQQAPSNQLIIGLALFLTFFIMQPVYTDIAENAYKPYVENEITREEAIDRGVVPLKEFMLKETREKDLALFLRAEGKDNVKEPLDLSMTTIIPAFAISELRMAFSIGFILYIPFLVIDMVVSSILMSMGMFMLPPVMISLPFKILLFVLVDGWYLVVESLLKSFA